MKHRALFGASVGICLLAALPARADEDGARFAALLRDAAPAIVTVKVVTTSTLQMGSQSRDRESRYELPGVLVDASGLVMTSIVPFAPERMIKTLAGVNDKGIQLKTVPGEIKVLFEQDEKENGAFLAATDSNLGVAFLQLDEPGRQKGRVIDFSRGAAPAVGDLVAAVSRLGRGYDSTPYFETARISGEIGKPRKAWVTDRGLSTLGLPIFSPAGRVLGVLAVVDSGLSEADPTADQMFATTMRMLTGGGGMIRTFIVPAPTVAAVIDQARQQAHQKAAERAAKKAAPPPPPPSP